MEDKRRCHRLNIILPAILTVDGEENASEASTIDISAKGVRLRTGRDLKSGYKLTLKVDLPEDGVITMHAEVVWVKSMTGAKKEIHAGIKIDDSMPADEAKFVRFYAQKLTEFFNEKTR